jgi:hypothetical protein
MANVVSKGKLFDHGEAPIITAESRERRLYNIVKINPL